MAQSMLTAEAKAAIRANLELELNARKEKLRAMCEAQCASLRSRLERRVNRIPASKRNMTLQDLLDASVAPPKVTKPATKATRAAKTAVSKKEVAPPIPAPAPVPTRAANTAPPAPATRKRAATTTAAAKNKPLPKVTLTSGRGKKRTSDDVEKENDVEKPRKRAKAPAAAPAAPQKPGTRANVTTRAAVTQPLKPREHYRGHRDF